MHVTAIIAAGGRGRRFGAAEPKQLLSIGGRPILERSVRRSRRTRRSTRSSSRCRDDLAGDPPAYLRSRRKPSRSGSSPAARGGRTRWRTRLRRADAASDVIVIHDAARPFASADLIARTIAAAAESGAAVAAVQSRDTVKRTSASNAHGPAEAGRYVRETHPARDDLSRADAAGVPARRAARRARARRARWRRGDR